MRFSRLLHSDVPPLQLFDCLDTESQRGTTIEFIERPKRRNPPEKVYPSESQSGASNV
jgi:hypothetical protein